MRYNKQFTYAIMLPAIFFAFSFVVPAQKIRYNYLPGTNFSQYKTYKWQRVENASYPNEILDGQIIRAIDTQLGLKGLSKVDNGNTDLIVVYQAAVNQQQQWNAYNTGGGWGWGGWGAGWGGWGGGGWTTTTSSIINVGTLNVDFYDLNTKKQIWRGEATKTLDPPKDPNKLQNKLNKAVAKLLKNFPPKK
jgi:hypothetical protein